MMFEGNLADFEELVLSVRDRHTRAHIGEAVTNYNARTMRSAIGATWIAVTYDIISKIRELSQQGDRQATDFVRRVDAAIALRLSNPTESKRQLQNIENEILTVAHQTFEFLSDYELRDMERLREDRNLCAHPAFSSEVELFQPSAERVRMHIVQSITSLLQHPPVQGRSALARLKDDLLQPSFPRLQGAVSDFLDARYLRSIKAGLLDNLITVLLKTIIKQSDKELIGKEDAVVMSLVAIQRRHGARFADRLRHELPRLSDGSGDAELKRVMRLFRADKRCWSWMGKPSQIRVTEIVSNYSFDRTDMADVASCLEIDELRPLFAARITTFEMLNKEVLYPEYPHPAFLDDAIQEYLASGGFRTAERRFEKMIRPFIGVMQHEHVKAIVDGARQNNQIYAAGGTSAQLAYLFEGTLDLIGDTTGTWREYLQKMLEGYDKELDFYSGLRDKMVAAGIWP